MDLSNVSTGLLRTCSACMWTTNHPTGTCIYMLCSHTDLVFTKPRATRHTFLVTSRGVSLPVDSMFGQAPEKPRSLSEYVAPVRGSLQAAYELVRQTAGSQQIRQKDYYDRRVQGSPYNPDNRVLLSVPCVKLGLSTKLYKPWQGPYRVVKKLSDVTYKCSPSRGRERHM
jgi:hypothetical protein